MLVSTIPPPVWRNPVGAAYCAWLETQLKGPGVSPQGYLIFDKTLEDCVILRELADAPKKQSKRNLGVHQFQALVIANRSRF